MAVCKVVDLVIEEHAYSGRLRGGRYRDTRHRADCKSVDQRLWNTESSTRPTPI
jgi:hypothetical protein